MHEIALTIGSLKIHWYGIMVAIGFVLAILVLLKERKRADITADNVFDLGLIAVFGGVLGARLFYVIQFHHQFVGKPLDVFRIDKGGLVFYGGFLLAFLGVWAYCRWKKLSFMRVVDIYAPAVAMGHASGRIGCFLQGCCFGKPVHSSWPSVVFPAGSAPAQRYPANSADLYANVQTATHSMPLIPVQLYEAACNFLIALLLLYLLKKIKRPGGVAAIYLAAYAIMRFCMELMRGDHTDHIGIFTPSQAIALFVMLPVAAIVFYFAGRNTKNDLSSGQQQ